MSWLSIVQPIPRTSRVVSWSVWLLAGIAAFFLIDRWLDALNQPLPVFPAYYTAAKMIQNGEPVALFYDDEWFRDRVMDFAPGRLEAYIANTPFLAFFFLPLANLPYEVARHITSVLTFAALLISVHLMTIELRITGAWRAAAFLVVFVAPTTLSNISVAQVYPIVLLNMVLAWRAWRRGADGLAGAFIGLNLAFKTAGLFLPLMMVFERRWRALLAAMSVPIIFAVITFPVVRYDGWEAYIHRGQAMGSIGLAFPGLLTLPGLALNLFDYDARLNPDPYFDAPLLARAIIAIGFVAFIAISARLATVTKDRDVAFALAVMASLILVPVTNINHTMLGFLPAFIIFDRLRDRMTSPLGLWFVIGGLLSFGPSVERIRQLVEWGGPIFFYPRLFGLVILVVVLTLLGFERTKSPSEPLTETRPA